MDVDRLSRWTPTTWDDRARSREPTTSLRAHPCDRLTAPMASYPPSALARQAAGPMHRPLTQLWRRPSLLSARILSRARFLARIAASFRETSRFRPSAPAGTPSRTDQMS